MRGNRLELCELVGADAERRTDGRIELAHRSASELVDPVVECPDTLDRPVRNSLGKRSVTWLEPRSGGTEGTVRVGVVLEHATHSLECGASRRRDAHCKPRRNSS